MAGHEINNAAVISGNFYSKRAQEFTTVCYTGSIEPNIILVDKDANDGQKNGTSWDDAFLDFNDALREAQIYLNVFNGVEIWVAGNPEPYKPPYQGTDYYNATFRIPDGNIAIRGHFGGKSRYETIPEQRDFNNLAYETILDGRIEPSGERASYVVTCDDIGDGLVLDGFTFRGGFIAGLYNLMTFISYNNHKLIF
jgi:hypothetical protein